MPTAQPQTFKFSTYNTCQMYVHVWSAHLLHHVAAKSGLHLLHPARQDAQQKDQRRNISTRLVAVCPAGNTLSDAARTSEPCFRRTTKTSVFQDAFTLLEYTLTHMRTICCTLTQHSRLSHFFRSASFASGPSLHAVARPSSTSSFSVSTCWSASNAHILSKARSCLCTCGHSLTPLPSLLYCFLC